VTVSLSQLPRGVSVDAMTQTVQTDKAVFVLSASPKADLVGNQRVKIVAKGPNGVEETQYMSVNVEY
jgi:hypothetical protein